MKTTSFITAVTLLIGATSAMAADAITAAPEAPAPHDSSSFSWKGAYGGVQGGFGMADVTLPGIFTETFDGPQVGGFVGYNFDLGNNLIAGIEGDINYMSNERDISGIKAGSDVIGSVRGRLGYSMDRSLFFVSGGWSAARINVDAFGEKADQTFDGWTAGAGVDYALTDKIFTRVEYRYTDLGSYNILGQDVEIKQNLINVGLAIKF
ncbi:outer membrane protein [Rhizobium halophytocola]|uniref:Outer membrane immunogenic protein n=1 Tax=Rhizobium halophytocola TaxID=735519 RepID=A0ABS4DTV1_9HYPH|nr:outer membrane beta-barrel protein [Rhizobium halophytocola]MBP1849049.1 outer membrane immunogenic protein [Rhizobium halophytocola]